jgi:hypothetical protein
MFNVQRKIKPGGFSFKAGALKLHRLLNYCVSNPRPNGVHPGGLYPLHFTLHPSRFMFNDQRSTINDQRSTINDQRSTINDQRPTINDQRISKPDFNHISGCVATVILQRF